MNWVDLLFIVALIISSGFGILRGMFKEILSLLTWVFAFVIAQSFWPALDYLLQPLMSEVPSLRAPLAWGALFVSSILIGSLLQHIAFELIRVTGLTGSDRALGAIFGLLRGIVIIVLLLTFAPLLTDWSQDSWWQESTLIPVFSAFKNSVMLALNGLIDLVQGVRLN